MLVTRAHTCDTLTRWRQELRWPLIDVSIFDSLLFVLGVAIIAEAIYWWNGGKMSRSAAWGWTIGLGLLLGIVTHWLLGVPTVLGWLLGLNAYPPRFRCQGS